MPYVIFELLFWLAVVALPVWIWLDAVAALWAALTYLVLHILIQNWKFRRFQKWLNSASLQVNPDWNGAWLDVAARINRQQLLADKAYDSNAIVQEATEHGREVVIPPKINRKQARPFDSIKYRARHLIENLFQRMKIYRRIATRYEKLDTRFLSFVHLVGAMKWLH